MAKPWNVGDEGKHHPPPIACLAGRNRQDVGNAAVEGAGGAQEAVADFGVGVYQKHVGEIAGVYISISLPFGKAAANQTGESANSWTAGWREGRTAGVDVNTV